MRCGTAPRTRCELEKLVTCDRRLRQLRRLNRDAGRDEAVGRARRQPVRRLQRVTSHLSASWRGSRPDRLGTVTHRVQMSSADPRLRLRTMRVAVTGATGFIGAAVARALSG